MDSTRWRSLGRQAPPGVGLRGEAGSRTLGLPPRRVWAARAFVTSRLANVMVFQHSRMIVHDYRSSDHRVAHYFPGRINLVCATSPEIDTNPALVGEAFGHHIVSSFDMLQCANFGYVTPELKMPINGLAGANEAAIQDKVLLLPSAFQRTGRGTVQQLGRLAKYLSRSHRLSVADDT